MYISKMILYYVPLCISLSDSVAAVLVAKQWFENEKVQNQGGTQGSWYEPTS